MRIIIPPLASVFLLAPTNYVTTFNKNVNTINQTQPFCFLRCGIECSGAVRVNGSSRVVTVPREGQQQRQH